MVLLCGAFNMPSCERLYCVIAHICMLYVAIAMLCICYLCLVRVYVRCWARLLVGAVCAEKGYDVGFVLIQRPL